MKKRFLIILMLCICFILKVENLFGSDLLPDGGIYTAIPTLTLPVIDGVGNDACWSTANWASMNHIWIGPSVNTEDYSGKYKALWTPQHLYILMEIEDDTLCLQPNNLVEQIYNYECAEIFIDEDNSRETNYAGTYKAIAYHINSTGGVYYYLGNAGWTGSLSGNLNYKVSRVARHTFHWEFELKVFDKSFIYGGTNVPVVLTSGKTMGLSLAYNDNDGGTTRQNMFGSVLVPGTTDSQRNVSYYNASVFGKLTLGIGSETALNQLPGSSLFVGDVYYSQSNIHIETANANGNISIQLFDLCGKIHLNTSVQVIKSTNKIQINVSDLPTGVYLVHISSLEKQIVKKIIIRSK